MGTDVTLRLESPIFSPLHTHTKSLRQGVYLQLLYHYSPFREKKSSSWASVDTSKATHILRRRSLLHFSCSTSKLTFSASTYLRNLGIFKRMSSQCRYRIYTLDSSDLPLLTSIPTILGLDTSS
ncbi:hypothetical protein Tco_0486898 [Tanacetum coccineum]